MPLNIGLSKNLAIGTRKGALLNPAEYLAYLERVVADGGIIDDNQFTLDYLKFLKQQGTLENTKLLIAPEMGTKRRVSGVNTYVSKAYDAANSEDAIEKIDDVEFNTPAKWNGGIYWTISNGKAVCINTGASEYPLYPNPNVTSIVSKQYIVTLNVISATGFVKFYAGSTSPVTFTGTGIKTATVIGSSGALFIVCQAGQSCEIESISIKEVQANDAVQATELSQPWLSGTIAPNERLALKNPNNGSRFLTHSEISFAANEAWSISFIVNINNSIADICVYTRGTSSEIRLKTSNINVVRFVTSSGNITLGTVDNNITKHSAKNTIYSIVYNNGNTTLYINGISKGTVNLSFPFSFYRLLDSTNPFFGMTKVHRIQSSALTPEQVTAEYNFLRAKFPEMESVVIGSQEWTTSNFEAVATPMGNVIQEMQANAKTDRVNDNAAIDNTGLWGKIDCNLVFDTDHYDIVYTADTQYITRAITAPTLNSYVKISFKVKNGTASNVTGRAYVFTGPTNSNGVGVNFATTAEWQEISTLVKVTGSNWTQFGIYSNLLSGNYQVKDVLVQELGWANSTEIYDAVYAATSGTVEQKTYAAVKEAAMWCHYNNSPDLGAIYGKLYNWYAAKLLQMDIDYYNAANPTTPWGWRVPLSDDWNTLVATLGGASVAGGKMKVAGTDYWTTPNTGADNNSGFTLLPAGWRSQLGIVGLLNTHCAYFGLDNTMYAAIYSSTEFSTSILGFIASRGASLRLIKTT